MALKKNGSKRRRDKNLYRFRSCNFVNPEAAVLYCMWNFHTPPLPVLDFWSNRPALFGHFQSGDGGCVELSSLNSPFPGHEERESLNSYCQRVYLHRVGVAQRGRTGPKMDENGGPTG